MSERDIVEGRGRVAGLPGGVVGRDVDHERDRVPARLHRLRPRELKVLNDRRRAPQ